MEEELNDKQNLKKRLVAFSPAIVSFVISVILCIVYTAIYAEREAIIYLEMLGLGLIPVLFPLYSVLTKKSMPVVYTSLAGVMVILSALGSGFEMYYIVPWWDTLLHGAFGTLGAAVIYKLSLDWQGKKYPVWRLFVVFFFVMGIGAMWEIFEYFCDCFFGADAQKVQYCISIGVSPVADTMEDLIITVVGIFVFYLGLLCKYLICRRINKNKVVGENPSEELIGKA